MLLQTYTDNGFSGGGYTFSKSRHAVIEFKHHVRELKDEVELISMNGGLSSSYCLDVQNVCKNLLKYWNPYDRYKPDGHILNNKVLAEKIHTEVEALMELIIKMEIDGVLI